MSVSLVAITQPTVAGVESPEDFIAYAARVSNPANQMNTETSEKLLKYLIKNHHWSPFEMVHVCLEINTTRDIARQILRHRSFSFQEFSQRYADASQLGYTVREARLQDHKNRQNSIAEGVPPEVSEEWEELQILSAKDALRTYQWALDKGVAKEVARSVLPEGLMNSRLYMSGTIRSWYHYCELRCAHGTQKEHMDIAKQCRDILSKEFPSVFNN